MSKYFKKRSGKATKIWERRGERSAYEGKKSPGFQMCPKCHAFYYKKSWHHNADMLSPKMAQKLQIKFILCPADMMIKKRLYEGKLVVEKVPGKLEVELLNIIKGYCARAYARDSQDRLIGITKRRDGFVVTTTENQMAQKLARKIQQVFNKVDVSISYSKEPYEVERIVARFI